MHLGEPCHERQADPRARRVHGIGTAVEGVEDLVAQVGRDPRAGVLDRDHGGRAWVQEREGGGSSFRVLLPDRTG